MSLRDSLLPEYDHEIGTTRRLLERVPDDKLTWRPHERSMSLGRLASHLADVPGWVASVIGQPAAEIDPPEIGATATRPRAEILALFDRNAAAMRRALAEKSDAELAAPFTIKRNGHAVFTLPKIALVRSVLLNHMIHHRGQLSVYLRMNDVPLPPIYGPSADEAW